MPIRARRTLALTVAAMLAAPLALALSADNQPLDRIADGEFDSGAVSLRMPAIGPFPLIVGGWGARGAADSTLIRADGEDDPAVEVRSRPAAPVHLIQDVPVATRSFRLHLEVMRLRGPQTLKLVAAWNRENPATAGAELAIRFGADSLRVDTASTSWRVERGLSRQRWVSVDVVADVRSGLLEIYLDDILVAGVPGTLETAPQTLLIGPGDDDGPSLYRYDSFSLVRTAEAELARVRRETLRWAPAAALPYLEDRLDAAATALSRGADPLAVPELRAAGRLLERLADDDPDPAVKAGRRELGIAVADLVELLQLS